MIALVESVVKSLCASVDGAVYTSAFRLREKPTPATLVGSDVGDDRNLHALRVGPDDDARTGAVSAQKAQTPAACERLVSLPLPNATITLAQVVNAGTFAPPVNPATRGGGGSSALAGALGPVPDVPGRVTANTAGLGLGTRAAAASHHSVRFQRSVAFRQR